MGSVEPDIVGRVNLVQLYILLLKSWLKTKLVPCIDRTYFFQSRPDGEKRKKQKHKIF